MPQALGMPSLAEYRANRGHLMNWCQQNSIGITDLIECIDDADENNPQHVARINSFLDVDLEAFNQITPTNILSIIEKNKETLCGVYLTRYEHTLHNGQPIHTFWNIVKNRCQELNIQTHGLVTPSGGYFVMTREQKISLWRRAINLNCVKSFMPELQTPQQSDGSKS
ncbi:hypothetical protein [Rufibacter latericius]|nr:hypothetical protein [Rufibacter latericius]